MIFKNISFYYSKGFGNAFARRLDLNGFTVIAGCLDTKSDGAISLKESTSGHMTVVQLDVTDKHSVDKCMEIVKSKCDKKGDFLNLFIHIKI